LIFKLPSGTGSQKSVVADAANLADILPTVLEIIGASSLKEVQGRSLVSSIAGKPTTTEAENYAETYLPRIHFNWSELRGVRFRQYHFIDAPRPELYDLTADPHELKNLYSNEACRSQRDANAPRAARYAVHPGAGEKNGRKNWTRSGVGRAFEIARIRCRRWGYRWRRRRTERPPSGRFRKIASRCTNSFSDALADSQRGHYAESIQKLQQAEKAEKDSLPVHYLLALNYYRPK